MDGGQEDPLFDCLPRKFEAFQWHEDTFDIPKGAVCLAASRSCPNQAFRFGRNAYGLQFHVEVTPAIIASWIKDYMKEEKERLDAKAILLEAYEKREAFERQADILYLNFTKIMKDLNK
jgi:GMP synthase-like glutamine amidotransferase